jgi:transcriptional regulator with XRE-family HTH domain
MQKIAEFRKRTRYSQNKLAAELGVSGSAICEIEAGKRNLTYKQIRKLLELGASLEEVFGENFGYQKAEPVGPDALQEIRDRLDRLEGKA